MGERSVLVVDDRSEARSVLAGRLSPLGFQVIEANGGEDAWSRFRQRSPDLVVSDLRMPRVDGIELLARIRRVSSVPVFLVSASADVDSAVRAMQAGAQEFITLPEGIDRLVERARSHAAARTVAPASPEDWISGRSASVRLVRERVVALASLRVPVLVCGEPGSGRDRAARALHRLGRDSEKPFSKRIGSRDAEPDTRSSARFLYLDEIGALSRRSQARWLALLESGGEVRLVASTSEDLAARVRAGTFLSELAESLIRFRIDLVPLRERPEDVSDLSRGLLAEIGGALGRLNAELSPAALASLRRQPWPGNVAELAQVLERLVAFSSTGRISSAEVRSVLRERPESVDALRSRREARQRDELVQLLSETSGNLAEVGRRLGLSRGAVIYRARKHGLLGIRGER